MAYRNWSELIEEQKQSGKSIPQFCSDKGVHYSSFYNNRKRLKKSSFVEVKSKLPVIQDKESLFTLEYKDFTLTLEPGYDNQSLTDLLKILRDL